MCWFPRQYPTYQTDLSIKAEIQNLAVLRNNPKPARISKLLADLHHWVGRLTPGSYGSNEVLLWLVAKGAVGRVLVNGRAQGESPQQRRFVCATFGAGVGERKRPAPERLPCRRRRPWEPWPWVSKTPTRTGDYSQKCSYHGQCTRSLLA